jgi:alkaline phosphatase
MACSPTGSDATNSAAYPKVILIIGDGMDDQQISIARNYLAGGDGNLVLDAMQYRGAIQPQTVLEDDPAVQVYVTGSASAATAMASGVVSSGQRISTHPQSGVDAVTIMELANDAGIATGVVTTASVTDATPASFMAHTGHRSCQGPDNMVRTDRPNVRASFDCTSEHKSRGGKGSIAEQIADGDIDVVLGGGRRYFDQAVGSDADTSVADLAQANGFTLITERSELSSIPPSGRLLGLFSPGLMPPVLRGNGASPEPADPFTCEENPEFGKLPRLPELVSTAINRLENNGSFILVVEDEAIDEHTHGREPCGHIGGVSQIDESVRLVLKYAESHPELLVIVTADHGHAAQIISASIASGEGRTTSPGSTARLITADGTVLGINYGTTTGPNSRAVHSGVQVPLLASGPGVNEWPVFIPQTELFHIMRKHLGLEGTLAVDNRRQ